MLTQVSALHKANFRHLVSCCLLTLSGFLSTLGAQAETTPEDSKLLTIADTYFTKRVTLDPLEGSATIGGDQFEGKVAIAISPSYRKALHQNLINTKAALSKIDLSKLKYQRTSYDMLNREIDLALAAEKFNSELMPVDRQGGFPAEIANLGTGLGIQKLKTPQDYDHYLQRLLAIPQWNEQAIKNMQLGIKKNIVLPKAIAEKSLVTLKGLTVSDLQESPYFQAIKILPNDFSDAEKKRITQAYTKAVETKLIPSTLALVSFIENQYLPNARHSSGLLALPNGKAWYEYQVNYHTSTNLTADAIHALGLQEVDRIQQEIRRVQESYGFKGNLKEFLQWQAQQSEVYPFKTEAEILQTYTDLNNKILPKLPSLFGRTPKSPLEIHPEPELTKATMSDHYNTPSLDGTRPGIFYAVINDPTKYASTTMTSLLLHEGQPGHHFHIALQQEMELPNFRKFGWVTAFGEGWALYAETLGKEMGLYEDKNQYLGHLKLELHRAVRLVTDTGLHAKGWTREQTIQYMMDTQGVSEAAAINATERYMEWPGQALAYKIGALKIQELRLQAENKLGAKFSIRNFHDFVLSEGVLPLSILEQKFQQWLASQKTPEWN